MHLMEEAVYELMEIFRVSEEAETAQKNSNEKVYRGVRYPEADRISSAAAGRNASGEYF